MSHLKKTLLETPLGTMVAVAGDEALHLLEFADRRNIDQRLNRLSPNIQTGRTKILDSLEEELAQYFAGNLRLFKTPVHVYGARSSLVNSGGPQSGSDSMNHDESHIASIWSRNDSSKMGCSDGPPNSPNLTARRITGTPFQVRVWEELLKIPYGKTISYAELATRIGQPSAFRAVAGANGANKLAIVIPCHRVIYANGGLGGYSGGLARKPQLLKIESSLTSLR